jgi:hypothetical protein
MAEYQTWPNLPVTLNNNVTQKGKTMRLTAPIPMHVTIKKDSGTLRLLMFYNISERLAREMLGQTFGVSSRDAEAFCITSPAPTFNNLWVPDGVVEILPRKIQSVRPLRQKAVPARSEHKRLSPALKSR